MQKTTYEIKREINRIYDSLDTNRTENLKALRQNIIKVEKLLLNKNFTPEEELSVLDSCAGKLQRFQSAYERWETELETWFANKIVKSHKFSLTNFEKYTLYARFVTLIKSEVRLAKISKNDRVLFIGSGPIPITAILVNTFTNATIDCFEKKKRYADISRSVIEKLGLSQNIHIYHKRGESFDNNDYTAVIIALLAKPKAKILKRIWETASPNTRIICRTSDGIRQLFYEQTSAELLSKLNPKSKTAGVGDQTISSVLLVKENN